MGFLGQLIVGLVLNFIGYLLMPKPPQQSQEVKDMEDPTADASRPLPVVFGSVSVRGPNIIWYGDKSKEKTKV